MLNSERVKDEIYKDLPRDLKDNSVFRPKSLTYARFRVDVRTRYYECRLLNMTGVGSKKTRRYPLKDFLPF